MSFAAKAAGSRNEVLESLRGANLPDGLGDDLRQVLVRSLEEAAEQGSTDSVPLRYEAALSGHSAPGHVLSCAVTVTASYVRPEPAEQEPQAQAAPEQAGDNSDG